MRNQLIATNYSLGGLSGRVYSAEGKLNDSYTAVTAYNNRELLLEFGPVRLNLSVEAGAELAKHINLAVAAAGGVA